MESSEDYIAMQTAVELAETSEMSQSEISRRLGISQSSLSRTLSDGGKRRLYLYGDHEDDRVSAATEDVDHDSELAELLERLDDIEEKLD